MCMRDFNYANRKICQNPMDFLHAWNLYMVWKCCNWGRATIPRVFEFEAIALMKS